MEHWLLDLKTGLRALRRSPSYAITAIVILGLAVGASATIFSVVHVLFVADPPHVVEPERLVRVHRTSALSDVGSLSYPISLTSVSTPRLSTAWPPTTPTASRSR